MDARHFLCCLSLLLSTAAACAEPVRVIYPSSETGSDTRFNDLIELLHEALEHTVPEFGPYELQASPSRP